MKANRIAPDGTPRFVALHLGLFCLPMSHIKKRTPCLYGLMKPRIAQSGEASLAVLLFDTYLIHVFVRMIKFPGFIPLVKTISIHQKFTIDM